MKTVYSIRFRVSLSECDSHQTWLDRKVFSTVGFQMHQCPCPSHTSGGFCVCVLFWDEVLLPDELRAVSVSLVTAYRTCVDCQRPPVDAASRGVHRQTVQQLGHHLQTCLWLIDILSSYTPSPKYTKALSPYLIWIIWSLKQRYLN